MNAVQPQMVELVLERLGGESQTRRVQVVLHDRSRQGVSVKGEADLNLSGKKISGDMEAELEAEVFQREFLRGGSLGASFGKSFGRLLFDRLFESEAVWDLWKDICSRLNGRRMQVLLVLPRELPWLASIPFELLCDREGFLFYRGHILVRTLQGVEGKSETLRPGMSALVAWANPLKEEGLEPISQETLVLHEKALEAATRSFGWSVLPTCRNATRKSLGECIRKAQPSIQILSLIAHGDPLGGAVWLCSQGDEQRGDLVSAVDLSLQLRDSGVELVFLWSCYSGNRHPVGGSVAEALIHPAYGRLSAVIAASGALRQDGTVPFFQRLLASLGQEAQGNLEQALAQARLEFGEEDLQWAAPVFYARPLEGRTVDVAAATERALSASLQIDGKKRPCLPYLGILRDVDEKLRRYSDCFGRE